VGKGAQPGLWMRFACAPLPTLQFRHWESA
jgi:hypothetical protein